MKLELDAFLGERSAIIEADMPLTKKGKKIMGAMEKEYGAKKGKKVFYASTNKGTIKGVHKGKKK